MIFIVKYRLLLLFGVFFVINSYAQKLDLPIDSTKKIVYNSTFLKAHLTKSELFNVVISWIKSDLKIQSPLILSDTIQFSREIPGYSTEYGGLTYVGLIKYKTTIIIEDLKFNIRTDQIYYIDNESKETINAEDILSKKEYMDKWHCLLDMDKSVRDLIYECDRKTAKKVKKKSEKFVYEAKEDSYVANNSILDNIRLQKAQEELKKASSKIIFGTATMAAGSLFILYSVNEYKGVERSGALLVGTGIVATGFIFSIIGIKHQRKTNKLLCDYSINKTELSLQIGINNISLSYKF
ncbi:MAG: hypothetical protein A2275_10470 [Bacteroidetes bacterium RIFOXYA12_FULL_35_11]|nr:MAG: hypothetical protein A2X01_12880 [Bacteroidetes bacterium GWF2_35_48]OFY74492.1 MAG: hypothetical protein A2275_10470 [Bacteroidetes bacterium RIFOXYA12_FULL_35_11]HBX50293.1 hypothetical protein [Bacteroidales bacterium]